MSLLMDTHHWVLVPQVPARNEVRRYRLARVRAFSSCPTGADVDANEAGSLPIASGPAG